MNEVQKAFATAALLVAGIFLTVGFILIAASGGFNVEFDKQIGNWWLSASILGLSATLLVLSTLQSHRRNTSVMLAVVALVPLGQPIVVSVLTGSTMTELSSQSPLFGTRITTLLWCLAIIVICGLVYGIAQAVIDIVWQLRQWLRSRN